MRKPSYFALAGLFSFSAGFSCHTGSSSQAPVTPSDTPVAAEVDGAASISADDMKVHVELLASDEYAGRETLQPGYEKAATYIAEEFKRYGLSPMPGQSDFVVPYKLWQHGYEMAETSLALTPSDPSQHGGLSGQPNLKVSTITATLGKNAAPFTFSDDGNFEGNIVFAGYGITAPELEYDDYAGLEVKDKWVLILRHAPGYRDEKSAFFGGERKEEKTHPKGEKKPNTPDPRQYSAFMTKALNAQEHGAKGMLLVSGPATAEMPDDLRMPSRLQVPLTDEEKAEREAMIKKMQERRAAAMAAAAEKAAAEAAKGKKGGKGKKDKKPKKGKKGKVAKKKLQAPEEKKLLAFHIAPALASELLEETGKSLAEVQAMVDSGTPAKKITLHASARASVKARKDPATIEAKNIVGYLEGSDPTLKSELVVIGGHFDHLGAFTGHNSTDKDTVFNGADDNASGTSGVLELAQAFAGASAPKRSMLFVAFSGEEKGLLGSKALAKQGPIDTDKVVFMLNLDMIGRNNEEPVEFVGGDYATRIRAIAESANEKLSVPLDFGEYAANSDHHSFFQREVPVAFFFTGLHEDYHGLSDHADKLDYPRMEQIVKLGYGLAKQVANDSEVPVFIHKLMWLGASVQKQKGDQGIIARISEVESDSRAAAAGLRTGDVIAKIDKTAIVAGGSGEAEPKSAGAMLRDIDPGSMVSLEILRDGKSQTLAIERAKRGYLGIFPGGVSDEDRQKFSLDKSEGILISRTVEGTPAFKSGLRDGDIITKLAGHSVNRSTLMKQLSRIGAGEKITVQLIRDGKRMELPLTLGEPPQR